MTENCPEYDIDTCLRHISPSGMEHHARRQKGKGAFYANLRIRHFIIKEIQDVFPELANQMKQDPTNATNIFSAFISILPLEVKGKLTEDMRKRILKVFNLI